MVLFDERTLLLIAVTIDLILFIALPGFGSRPIRPFRIFRCCKYINNLVLPVMYDYTLRKTFFSLASAYTDVLVYLVFFSIVVAGYALIGNRAMTFDPSYRDPSFP